MDTPKFLFLFVLSILILCSTGAVKDIEQQQLQVHDLVNLMTSSKSNYPTTQGPTPAIITVPSTTPVPVPIPVTNPPSTTTPVVAPPAAAGQSWCVAKIGASDTSLQKALDFACGTPGTDCSAIQQNGACYSPMTLRDHASYAFNSYYQKRRADHISCDFAGAAIITNVNPSSVSCTYPTTMTTPMTPTPATSSSSGSSATSPTILNGNNPPTTGFGDSPPTSSTSSKQPFIGCIIVVTSFITGVLVLDI